MNEVLLTVHPAAGGWWLACDLPLEPTYFRSGALAEQVARSLAIRLSGAGRDVKLVINDRSEQPVATHLYFAG
jgi:hypothetical protein